MPIDYSLVDRVFDLSFEKLGKPGSSLAFPKPGTLFGELNALIDSGEASLVLSHTKSQMLASGSVEMWHRAIHSFLWSVTLTKTSPLWASVSGYYASHYVMRAFAHSMGIFKSFTAKKVIQVEMVGAQFVLSCSPPGNKGEHPFYWNVVRGYPRFARNPLFYENDERKLDSDSAHRTFANYTDHVNTFKPMKWPDLGWVMQYIEKMSHLRLGYSEKPSRDEYPDLENVQILAFQRIVAFNDFLDERIPTNRFWLAHRRPAWCKDLMLFQIEDSGLESPGTAS